MERKSFNKYDVKNILIQALCNSKINSFLNEEFQCGNQNEGIYFDAVNEICDKITSSLFKA